MSDGIGVAVVTAPNAQYLSSAGFEARATEFTAPETTAIESEHAVVLVRSQRGPMTEHDMPRARTPVRSLKPGHEIRRLAAGCALETQVHLAFEVTVTQTRKDINDHAQTFVAH